MALTGWTKKSQITVAASKLAQTVSNQVVLFTAGHFHSEMVTLGHANACKSDGSDLRFSSDANGDTLLAFDVLRISLNATPSLSALVVAIRFPTVTANASFSFYCHWGNSAAETPATTNAVGSGNCWSALYGCIPLQEDPSLYTTTAAKWKAFKEKTGRYSAGNIVSSPTQVDGPIPGMKAVQVSTAGGYITIPEVVATNRGGFQFAMVVNFATVVGLIFAETSATSTGFYFLSSGVAVVQYNGDYSQNYLSHNNVWGILRAEFNGTNFTFRFQTQTSTLAWSGPFTNLQQIGGGTDSMNAKVCLFMVNIFTLVTDDYFKNLLNSINNNATLASSGSISSVSSSSAVTLRGMVSGSRYRVEKVSDGSLVGEGTATGVDVDITYTWASDFNARLIVRKSSGAPKYLEVVRTLTLTQASQIVIVEQQADPNSL